MSKSVIDRYTQETVSNEWVVMIVFSEHDFRSYLGDGPYVYTTLKAAKVFPSGIQAEKALDNLLDGLKVMEKPWPNQAFIGDKAYFEELTIEFTNRN